jgi:hypothetical protein
VTLGHAGGAVGVHEGGWRSPVANFYRCVEGADGGAQTDEWGGKLYLCPRQADRIDTAPDPDFDLRGDWLDAIEGRSAAGEADVRWARGVMAVGEAVFASAAAGGAVVRVIPRNQGT